MQGDNEVNGQPCDNISDQNATYSEFTGMYWAWKNLRKVYPDVKYVGWSHYRRFFAFDESKDAPFFIGKPESEILNYKVNAEKVIDIVESGKIIMVKPFIFETSVAKQYGECHYYEDYRTLKKVIEKKFPDYYEAFIDFMEKNNSLPSCCMFVMKYDDFVKCCEWLFAVLAEVEQLVPYQYYPLEQKRFLAFLGERLINVYVLKNKMQVAHHSIYFYRPANNGGVKGVKKESKREKRIRHFKNFCYNFCIRHRIFLWALHYGKKKKLMQLFAKTFLGEK